MSYLRRPMGDAVTSTTEIDGPITSPSQWNPSDTGVIAGEVPANRVPCDQLPADSPWRRPGQVCAPTGGILDSITNLLTGAASGGATAASNGDAGMPWLLIAGAAGVAGYLILKKKKKSA